MKRAIATVLILAAVTTAALHGDEESAAFYAKRGEIALAKLDYVDARSQFNQALAEQRDYLRAVFGLAKVEEAEGNRNVAVGLLDRCLARDGERGLSSKDKGVIKNARKMFAKLHPVRLELRDLVFGFRKRLLKIAAKNAKGDPELSRICLERILEFVPGDPLARSRLVDLIPAGGIGKPESLFDGTSLHGWGGNQGGWSVKDRCLHGDPGEGPRASELRSAERYDVDYDLVVEMRSLSAIMPGQMMGIMFGSPMSDRYYYLGPADGGLHLVWVEKGDMFRCAVIDYEQVAPGFRETDWHVYRVEVRGKTVTIRVDGREMFTWKAKQGRDFKGYLGFICGSVEVQVRRVGVAK